MIKPKHSASAFLIFKQILTGLCLNFIPKKEGIWRSNLVASV
jgi:hypothetical protein